MTSLSSGDAESIQAELTKFGDDYRLVCRTARE
jgi:hypothetical protein